MCRGRIGVLDTVCAFVASATGFLVRTDTSAPLAWHSYPAFWVAVALPGVWVAAMLVSRSYEQRFLWVGPEEFRRVFGAAILLLARIGTLSWALRLGVLRVFVVVALPLATALTLLHRYVQRRWLHHRR